jgi:hypothetical protein
VVEAFRDFFEPFGDVQIAEGSVSFAADATTVATGLELRRDGSSTSFTPLHRLVVGWDDVVFDRRSWAVTLVGPGATYTYEVPPVLRGPSLAPQRRAEPA